jgi:hemerythrin
MAVLYWHDGLRTGDAIVDGQHEELFRIVNRLHDAMLAGQGREGVQATVEALARYAVAHFACEERLMERSAYPGLAVHRQHHAVLQAQVGDFVASLGQGEVVSSLAMSRLLADWIAHHITEDDQLLVGWLRRHPLPDQTA